MKRRKHILLSISILLIFYFFNIIVLADSSVERLVFSTTSGIFVLEVDSTEAKKISSDYAISKLVEYKGNIYYSTQNTVFKSIDPGGNNTSTYTEMNYYPDLDNIIFINDNIYFPLMSSSPTNYYKISIDNNNLKKLFDGNVEEAVIDDNLLYIISPEKYLENVIYKLKMNQDSNDNIEENEYYFSGKYLFYDGEWFYFDNRNSKLVLEGKTGYFKFSELPEPFLYRINKDTLANEKIPFSAELKKNIHDFTLYNNNVYFLSGDITGLNSEELYKLSLEDLSIKRIVNNDNIIKYKIYQDNLYYFERINETCYLWKCSLEGRNNTIITKVDLPLLEETEAVFTENYIFYKLDNCLCRLTQEGTDKVIISSEYPVLYFTMSEHIYYQTSSGFYKFDFDGREPVLITSEKINDYVLIK